MPARSQPGFVAVSTNPAIDRVARIEGPPTGVVRASELLETPGGKAIHAACVAAELGADTAVITTAGGRAGDHLLALLAAEPLDVHHVAVAGSTRGTYTLVGAGDGELVEVHEPSGSLTEEECDRLVAVLAESAAPRAVAVCGSLPPEAPVDLHARLIATGRELGAFTILDCSSQEALAAGVAEAPDLVAPNLAEAGRLLEATLDPGAGDAEMAAITGAIRDRGAAAVWLSLGPSGSFFADAAGMVRLTTPAPDRPINAVGCGDALVGGLAAGLVAGHDLLSAVRLGAAAASDKLAHLHPGRVDRAAVETRLRTVTVNPIPSEAAVS
jgi:1-phosphofructokinase family hexose kinase